MGQSWNQRRLRWMAAERASSRGAPLASSIAGATTSAKSSVPYSRSVTNAASTIPGTRAEDGDALDVLVLQLPPSFPGCLVTVRLIGVLHAEQREGGKRIRNDRLIGVADTPVNPARLEELSALDEEELRAIEHFLKSYNAFQGREFEIKSRGDSRDATRILDSAIEAHSADGS